MSTLSHVHESIAVSRYSTPTTSIFSIFLGSAAESFRSGSNFLSSCMNLLSPHLDKTLHSTAAPPIPLSTHTKQHVNPLTSQPPATTPPNPPHNSLPHPPTNPARASPPPPQTPLHLHATRHPIRRQRLHHADHLALTGLPLHARHAQRPVVEPQQQGSAERGGG